METFPFYQPLQYNEMKTIFTDGKVQIAHIHTTKTYRIAQFKMIDEFHQHDRIHRHLNREYESLRI